MSNNLIVTDSQQLEIASAIVEVFELTLGVVTSEAISGGAVANSNILYFHAGKDLDSNTASKDLLFDGNTYVALPVEMDDIERKTGGAMNRPSLTVANVESIIKTGSDFKTQMEDGTWSSDIDGETITAINFELDDLVGQRVTRRRTLQKYTGLNQDGSAVTPYEFDKQTFIIDRISAKSSITVTFELASPADIGGLRIPNRQVIGKYCPWVYQGQQAGLTKSACSWGKSQQIQPGEDGEPKFDFYFTKDDEPLVLASFLTGSETTAWKGVYDAGRTGGYDSGEYVEHQSTVTSSVTASANSSVTISITANVGVQIGDIISKVSGAGTISGTVTVVTVIGTYVKLSSAVTLSSGATVKFTGAVLYYRSRSAMPTPIAPLAAANKWKLVRTYTTWSSGVAYAVHISGDIRRNPYVRHDNTIWRCTASHSSVEPGTDFRVWVRGDVCGKLLESCKIRYQGMVKAKVGSNTNGIPHDDTDTARMLPFGGFPGSKKFR